MAQEQRRRVAAALGEGFLWLALAAAMAAVLISRVREPGTASLRRALTDSEPALMTLEGVIAEAPRTVPRRGALAEFAPPWMRTERLGFWMDVAARVEGSVGDGASRVVPASGRVWVAAPAAALGAGPLRAGDCIRITGMARAPAPPRNPGEDDERLAAAAAPGGGVAGFVTVADERLIERLEGAPSMARWLIRARALLRQRAVGWFEGGAGEADARGAQADGRRLLALMLLGEPDERLQEVRDAFTRLGLTHLLAISGVNLTILAVAASWALRLLGLRPWAHLAIVVALVAGYTLILPVQPPVLRAAIMAVALLAAEASGRRYGGMGVLGWTLVIVLAWRPMDLFTPGLQLSFGCVAALVGLAEPVRERLFGGADPLDAGAPATLRSRLVRDGQGLISATIAAWAVSTPCIAHHIGVVTPAAIPASVATIPVFTGLVGAGYAGLLAAAVFPSLGALLSPLLGWAAGGLAWAVTVAERMPGASLPLPWIGPWLAVALTALAVWWLRWGTLRRGAWRRPANLAGIAASVAAAVWAGAVLTSNGLPRDVALRVDMLSVGDGSCLLLRSGDRAALWDCGSGNFAMGRREIPAAVRALRARIGASAPQGLTVFVTHPDLDHFSALLDVVEPLGVTKVVVGERFHADARRSRGHGPEALVLGRLRERGVAVETVSAGWSWRLGEAEMRVVWPPQGASFTKSNNASLVALLRVPGVETPSLLLTGDAEDEAIEGVIAGEPGLRASVMEIPHHGSFRREAARLVGLVKPTIALQSTGPKREGDERWDRAKRGVPLWLMTSRGGAAWAEVLRSGEVRGGAMWE